MKYLSEKYKTEIEDINSRINVLNKREEIKDYSSFYIRLEKISENS
jgi:hypothetical protein